MTTVSGPLSLVTEKPALVHSVQVRAKTTRPHDGGLIVDFTDTVTVEDGVVTFECAPGPAVLIVSTAGVPAESVPLLVPDGKSEFLEDCVQAALLSDDATMSEISRLSQRVLESLRRSENAAASAAAFAREARTSAKNSSAAGVAQRLDEELPLKADKQHTHTMRDITDLPIPTANDMPDTIVMRNRDAKFFIKDPTLASHAATKRYVDNSVGNKADKSHKHSTSDINGLENFVDGRVWNIEGIPKGTDLNDVTTTGIYWQGVRENVKSELNYPDEYPGILRVYEASTHKFQVWLSWVSEPMFFRGGNQSGGTVTWWPWREVSTKGHQHVMSDIADFPDISQDLNGNTLVQRDSLGRITTREPYLSTDAATKGYVDRNTMKVIVGDTGSTDGNLHIVYE